MKNSNIKTESMQLYRQNPKLGFEAIYKEYSGPVFRYLRGSFSLNREEAEDILHTVFLPWVKEPEKLFKVEKPASYLFSSARNAALRYKKQSSYTGKEVEVVTESHDTAIEANMIIKDALNELPEEQKEAVILKVWIKMTFEEIAKIQECTLQTVASRYRYAIGKLKELIPWNK